MFLKFGGIDSLIMKFLNLEPAIPNSDVLEGKNGQTSHVKAPVKRPGMIQPSSDSQHSIGQPVNIITNDTPKKNKRILLISHQVPISFCGARRKPVYLEAVFQIFGLIDLF
ncbi:hypothetical protein VP01_3326g4 [Puccinia sorghi]|uniref:Uncharacterized protein n=1 Tax=Puccinia sorghi TaxID=27349 RepID=A0A0L6UZ46_9BASI|nr:hypothetical protein VP01_3326g4 [Puccinia sorghi]